MKNLQEIAGRTFVNARDLQKDYTQDEIKDIANAAAVILRECLEAIPDAMPGHKEAIKNAHSLQDHILYRMKVEYTDEELRQRYANARTTKAQCGGHGKAARNENATLHYADELKKRGLEVPTDEWAFKYGRFNGKGAV